MKVLTLFLLTFSLSLPLFAQSKLCEVYGITDSPQKLDCSLGGDSVKLRCREGVYYLNESEVTVAYHEEVEEGPTPLIFRTADSKLSIMMYSSRKIEGQLSRDSRSLSGTCRP